MNCPIKSQSEGLTFHKTWNVVKEKPSRSGQSNLFSFYIPLIRSCFSLVLLGFFYSFLPKFVLALVQSSPTANDDHCWRFCCCHTKLVHSEHFQNFRYYFFFLYFEILKQSLLIKNEQKWYLNNTSNSKTWQYTCMHRWRFVQRCVAIFFSSHFSQFLIF